MLSLVLDYSIIFNPATRHLNTGILGSAFFWGIVVVVVYFSGQNISFQAHVFKWLVRNKRPLISNIL